MGCLFILRFGISKVLFIGAAPAASTNLLFVLLAQFGNELFLLVLVISADNLSAGIASAAFVAYLSGLTSSAFTASQYALFSSIMLLLPKLIAGYSGMIIEAMGYSGFFCGTFVLGLPVLLLIYLVFKTPESRQIV